LSWGGEVFPMHDAWASPNPGYVEFWKIPLL
jgi:hypothetical protein